MGIIRDSFVMFKNWAEAIEALPEEYQLETYKAVVSYGLNGEIPQNLSAVSKAMLISFSKGMENSILRYNASVENGKKGGRPKKENLDITEDNQTITQENLEKPSKTQENLDEPNHNLNVNVNVNDNDIIKKRNIKEKKEIFSPPTLEEIKEYAYSRNSSVDCQKFFDYFSAGNWTDSNGKKVKNWKQKFITWESKEEDRQTNTKSMLERAAESLGVHL